MRKLFLLWFVSLMMVQGTFATCQQYITGNAISCPGASNGNAVINYLQTGMHFKWFNGDSTDVSLFNLPTGPVSADIYDSSYNLLCHLTATVGNYSIMTPYLSVTSIDTICQGIFYPGMTVEGLNTDTHQCSFQWSNGPDGMNFWYQDTLHTPGTYSVTITDTACPVNTATLSANLGYKPRITASYSGPALSICPGATLTFPVDIANDNGLWMVNVIQNGYEYGASGSVSPVTATASAGDYQVLVYDYNCPNDSVYFSGTIGTIVVYNAWTDVVTNSTSCSNCNGSVTFNPSGGTPPYYYSWYNNGGQPVGSSSSTLTQLCGDTYLYITVTDAQGCTALDSVTIINEDQFTLSASNTNITCQHPNDTTIVTVAGNSSFYIYNWGDGSIDTAASPHAHIYSHPGNYDISATDSVGCQANQNDNILNTGINIVLLVQTNPYCSGVDQGKIKISVSNGVAPYHYTWNNAATGDSLTGLMAGNYLVTVTDNAGCSASARYDLHTVNQEPGFYVFIPVFEATCNGQGSVAGQVSGGRPPYHYSWNTMPAQSTDTAYNLAPGTYSLTVTDSVGCQALGVAHLVSGCTNIITGWIFANSVNTCVPDTTSVPINGITVMAIGATHIYYGNTDATGLYEIDVPDTGTYRIVAIGGTSCDSLFACVDTAIRFDSTGRLVKNQNFTQRSQIGYDIAIHPGWLQCSPGFTKQYWVYCYSNSNLPYVGVDTVTFTYDEKLIYQYSLPPYPVNNPGTHTLTWILDTIGTWPGVKLNSFFIVPANISPNQFLKTSVAITPVAEDCEPGNNFFNDSSSCGGSHDPNEKTVSPLGGLTPADSVLTYTIHYQNTGTAATRFIVVTDTLTSGLDPATVLNLASSDTYSGFKISGTGILTWTFNPLSLPDSITDPNGSKGFITFSVKRKPNQAVGQTITNTAYIYFDYNTAVITNTVRDTLVPQPCAAVHDTIVVQTCSNAPYAFYGHDYSAAGTYFDTVTTGGGCDTIVMLILTIEQAPAPTFTATSPLCVGQSGNFTYTGTTGGGIVYSWNFGGGQISSGTGAGPFSVSWNAAGAKSVICNVNLNGCNVADTVMITVYAIPVSNAGVDTAYCNGDSASLGGPPTQGYTYTWQPNFGLSDPFISNPVATLRNGSDTAVSLTYTVTTLSNGCASTASVTVTVAICEGLTSINTTNLFTLYPNPADDYVMIDFDAAYTGASILVKDITGRQLFETRLQNSPQQIPTANLPAGVYIVTLYNNGQVGARLMVKD